MLRSLVSALAAGACLALCGSAAQARSRPALVPEPAEISAVDGAAALSPRWTVRVPANSPADTFAASLLIADIRTRFGWRWSLAEGSGPAVILRPSRPAHRATAAWNREGYELEVWPDSIVVRAPTEPGRYYGIQTLRQIVRGLRDETVPGLVIRDGPSFVWRGLSDDISRGQMSTLEDFRRTIATLGYYKANVYQLYIEDVFEFEGAPEIGRGRSRLSAAELRAIVEEGVRHHVTVIPIFETLGHQQRMLSLPGLNRYAEVQPVSAMPWKWRTAGAKLGWLVQSLFFGAVEEEDRPKPWSFAPSLPESRAFVKARITELSNAAPGAWFHIGGDEAFDVGRGLSDTPRGPARSRLLSDYFADLADHLRQHHRRTMVYADELLSDSTGLERAPKDMTLVYWNYRSEGADSALLAIRRAGFPRVHVSPGLWDWLSFAPNDARAFPNIASMVSSGAEARAEGVVVASWGDGGAEGHKVLRWPGAAYAADAAWCGAADSADAFLDRFASTHFGARRPALGEAIHVLGWQEFPNVGWYGRLYHRVPQVKTRDPQWLQRMRGLDRDMTRVRRLLRSEAPSVRWNRDQLEHFDHAARRFAFVARRDLLLHELARSAGDPKPRRVRRPESLERRLAGLSDESRAITAQYEKLWRASNRVGTLRSNLLRLDGQTAALDSIREVLFPGARVTAKAVSLTAVPAAIPVRPLPVNSRRGSRASHASSSNLELSLGY